MGRLLQVVGQSSAFWFLSKLCAQCMPRTHGPELRALLAESARNSQSSVFMYYLATVCIFSLSNRTPQEF